MPAKSRLACLSPNAAMPLYSLLTRIPRPLYLATALTLYLLLLWMGGQQSTVDHLPGRADFSKVYHLVFYSGWCCLAWLSMRQPGIATAVALTMLAGAGDELHQYFLPFREARVSDVLIDGCAALAGALWMQALRRRAMATVMEKAKVL
jgi:VanZ family protein